MTLKQIFIINKDLKMRAGKIAVQVAHGETLYMNEIGAIKCVDMLIELNNKQQQMEFDFKEWTKDGLMKKIVLKATREELLILICIIQDAGDDIWSNIVFDIGLTQVPINSITCVVFEPLDEEKADARFGHLKLL